MALSTQLISASLSGFLDLYFLNDMIPSINDCCCEINFVIIHVYLQSGLELGSCGMRTNHYYNADSLILFIVKIYWYYLWSPDSLTNLIGNKPGSVHVKSPLAVVQFCDFVSVSWMVNLAGRVISVLLDYVGQVSLCGKLTKILEKHKEWPHIQRTTGELRSEPQTDLLLLLWTRLLSSVPQVTLAPCLTWAEWRSGNTWAAAMWCVFICRAGWRTSCCSKRTTCTPESSAGRTEETPSSVRVLISGMTLCVFITVWHCLTHHEYVCTVFNPYKLFNFTFFWLEFFLNVTHTALQCIVTSLFVRL